MRHCAIIASWLNYAAGNRYSIIASISKLTDQLMTTVRADSCTDRPLCMPWRIQEIPVRIVEYFQYCSTDALSPLSLSLSLALIVHAV